MDVYKEAAAGLIVRFINEHQEYWKKNNICVEYNPSDITDTEYLNESIRLILQAYDNNIVNWDWSDYSEASVELLSLFCIV